MTEREQPPYPAGYHPVPDDDWREKTTPGLTPVRGPGSAAEYGGSTAYGRPSADQPPSYEPPRYQQPGYGQGPAEQQEYGRPDYGRPGYDQPNYGQSSYGQPRHDDPAYGRTDYGESGYGRSRYDEPAYGQTGYGEPAYAQSGYGEPGYGEPAYGRPGAPAGATTPAYSNRPVAVRRPDALAGLALILAGILAAVSLLVTWLAQSQSTGWTLLRAAFRDLGGLFDTGLWQPLAIIVAGVLLLVLGLLALVPARAHRTLGLLALLLTAAVGAGVVVPLVDANWDLSVFDLGFFLAIAVAVLGLIGSLKALLTGPRLSNHTPAY